MTPSSSKDDDTTMSTESEGGEETGSEESGSSESETESDSNSRETDSEETASEEDEVKPYDENNLDNFTITGNKSEKEQKEDDVERIPLVTVKCNNCTKSLLEVSQPGTIMYEDIMDSTTLHAHKLLVEKLQVTSTQIYFYAASSKTVRNDKIYKR